MEFQFQHGKIQWANWERESEQRHEVMRLQKVAIAEYRVPTIQVAYHRAQTGLQKSLLCDSRPKKISKVWMYTYGLLAKPQNTKCVHACCCAVYHKNGLLDICAEHCCSKSRDQINHKRGGNVNIKIANDVHAAHSETKAKKSTVPADLPGVASLANMPYATYHFFPKYM